MSEERESIMAIIAGTNGTGKSSRTYRYALSTGKPVLWITCKVPNSEFAKYPRVNSLEEFRKKKEGLFLFIEPELGLNPKEDKDFFTEIQKVKNAAITFDDAGDYLSANLHNESKRMMRSRRQNGQDLFFIYHSLEDIPPAMWRYTNYFVCFKTIEAPQRAIMKTPSFDRILKAWQEVSKAEKYTCKFVVLNDPTL